MSARPARATTAGQLALELPLELPPIALAPEWKDQQRLWGHAFHPMCSYLASFPAALTHAFIARYSRPGRRRPRPILRTRHDPAPGLRRGPDRRRQRPQPVRPSADRRQGRAGDAGPGRDPARPAPARLERRLGPAGSLSAERVARRPGRPGGAGPGRPAPATAPADGVEAVPVEVALAFHPRTLGQLLFVRTSLRLDDRTDRFLAAADHRDPPRQERELPVRADAEHVQHGAALRPRLRRPDGVRLAGARRLRRAREEARPPLPTAAAVDRGDRPARRRPRRRAACPRGPARARPPRPGPARRHLAALPAGRQVRLLQLAADVVPRASTRARSTRRSTTPTTASRTSPSCATSSPACDRSSPTTRSSSSSSATSRRTAAARSGAASGSRSAPGRPPPNRRATASPASRSTTSPRSAR